MISVALEIRCQQNIKVSSTWSQTISKARRNPLKNIAIEVRGNTRNLNKSDVTKFDNGLRFV